MTPDARIKLGVLAPNPLGSVCGLADHAMQLGQAVERCGGGQVVHLCRWATFANDGRLEGGPVQHWDGRARGIRRWAAGNALDWVLVELSPWGFSKSWGAPRELARALAVLRKEVRVAVCVHEVHTQNAAGVRSWFRRPFQWYWTRAAVRCADLVLPTNRSWYDVCRNSYGIPEDHMEILPIAANIPHLTLLPEDLRAIRQELGWGAAERVAVAFGRWKPQAKILQHYRDIVGERLRRGELDRVAAIGGSVGTPPAEFSDLIERLPWRNKLQVWGHQSADRVARLIAAADVGLTHHDWRVVERSGTFRAFQQAGLEIWAADGSGCRKVEADADPPTWESVARRMLERMQESQR